MADSDMFPPLPVIRILSTWKTVKLLALKKSAVEVAAASLWEITGFINHLAGKFNHYKLTRFVQLVHSLFERYILTSYPIEKTRSRKS